MEPMLPEEVALQSLEDSALKLVESASGLAKRAHPMLQQSVGDLVRSMNCYFVSHAEVPCDIRWLRL